MQSTLVLKKRYRVVVVLLAVILIYILYQISQLFRLEQRILRKISVNNFTSLYITEADADAGATTDFSYRYYLFDASKSDKDFMNRLTADRQPFLITADPNAFQKVKNNAIYLSKEIFLLSTTPLSTR